MLLFDYPFMLQALALCLLLTGVLSFFGYHVVRRGVIFVDLALAQVSALGSSVGLAMGFGEDRPAGNFAVSLGFAFLGALLFSWFRARRAPMEALIGITYAGAMALSLIILEQSAAGTEELKEMLIGSLLTVPGRQVWLAGALFAAAGMLLWLFRKPLFLVTDDPEAAIRTGVAIGLWDVFFYSLFGTVVTVSVRLAGVLPVFAFLIIPSLAAMVGTEGTWKRIGFGWVFGACGCVLGLEVSLRLDWPAGPAVVAAFILLLMAVGAASLKRKRG